MKYIGAYITKLIGNVIIDKDTGEYIYYDRFNHPPTVTIRPQRSKNDFLHLFLAKGDNSWCFSTIVKKN